MTFSTLYNMHIKQSLKVHAAGGGINFTVNATREASEAKLNELLLQRLDAMMKAGTTTCEVNMDTFFML